MDNAVYIVFSATPTGMGRLIRAATCHRYNHVSLSLSRDMEKMYSFARYHRTIPLYGGFVVESILRYSSFAGQSRVKVCRLSVDEPRLTYLRNYMERLWQEREEYLYNTPGALVSLLHCPLPIPKTHTCITFVHDIITRFRLAEGIPARCPSISRLEQLLEDYVVYEGPVPAAEGSDWGEDDFAQATTHRYAFYSTARHFGRLAKRALMGAT